VKAQQPGRTVAAVAGIVVAAVALGVAELVAGLWRTWRSPILDVGDRVIDAAPPFVKEFAIDTFGTNDKPALLIGIGTLLLVYAAVIGVLAFRHRLLIGIVGIGLFAAIGMWAASTRRAGGSITAAVPSLIGGAVGIGALVLIHRALHGETGAAADGTGTAGRRDFFRHSGAVIGGFAGVAAISGAGGRLFGRRFDAESSREDVDLPVAEEPLDALPASTELGVDGISSFVTPNADFYRIDTALTVPQVPSDSYKLSIVGMVDNEIELSYDDLTRRDLIERDITICCVSNEVGGRLIGNARWLGVPLKELLEEAGVQSGADQIVGRSVDGFACGFPVENALDGRDAMVAIGMNGAPLPLEHGFPARLIVPGLYGYVSATKWLAEIELTTFDEFDHYWLRRGWAQKAPIKTMSRIDTPRGLAKVPVSPIAIGGVAWAQTRGIESVDVRIDDGDWQRADLGDAPTADTWRQWVYRWADAQPGRHSITVRATDGTGAIQTAERAEPIPDGASGHHQIVVIVE